MHKGALVTLKKNKSSGDGNASTTVVIYLAMIGPSDIGRRVIIQWLKLKPRTLNHAVPVTGKRFNIARQDINKRWSISLNFLTRRIHMVVPRTVNNCRVSKLPIFFVPFAESSRGKCVDSQSRPFQPCTWVKTIYSPRKTSEFYDNCLYSTSKKYYSW